MALHIGTSGWNYKHWRETFYPKGLATAKWLPFYAERLDTVEINASFYRKPTADHVRAWQWAVPPGFTFAVKMWRGITHFRLLLNAADLLAKFMPIINVFEPSRRGPLLVQLPERMKPNPQRLDMFLADLRDSFDGAGWKVAIEFRNRGWLIPEVCTALKRHDAALVVHDMHNCRITEPNDVGWVYLRRHAGADAASPPGYTAAQIKDDTRTIRRWLKQGREVWVYYNNDPNMAAIRDARRLAEGVTKV